MPTRDELGAALRKADAAAKAGDPKAADAARRFAMAIRDMDAQQTAPKPAPAMQTQPAPKPAPMPMQSGQPNISPMGGVGEFDPKAFAGIELPQQQSWQVTDPSMLMLKPEARTFGNQVDANRSTARPNAPFLGAAQRQQIANERAFGQEPVDPKAIVAGMDRKTAELQTAADPFKSVFGNANVGGSMSLGGAPAIGVDPARPSMGTGDVYKAIGSAPARLERATVEVGQAIANLPSDTANSMGAASAQEVDPMVAMRNVNRAPQLTERVGQPAQDFKALPRFDFQGAKIPIPDWLDSTTGQFEEQIMQYAIGRGLIGNAAKGGNFMAQGAKDAATVLSAFDSSTPRISEIAADFMNANGLGWMAERDPNNPIMERVKNGLEELFTSVAPAKAIEAVPRGLRAIDNAFGVPATPTNAGGNWRNPGAVQTPPTSAAPPAAAVTPNAPAATPAPPQPPVTAVPSFQRQPVPTATAQAAGAPPIQPPPPAVATANAPVPTPGAVPPAGTLTPIPALGEAEQWFNSLDMKTRESIRNIFKNSNVKSKTDQDAIIRDLNSIPQGRNSQNAFLISQRWDEKYPSLRENLSNIGGGFAVTAPRPNDKRFLGRWGGKSDNAQSIMDVEGRKQVVSERGFLERSAEENFGAPSAEVAQQLKDELTGLSKRYNTLLAPNKTRKFGPDKMAQLSASEGELKAYLKQPWVIGTMPQGVRDRLMVDASEELRSLGWTADELKQMAGPTRAKLAPLFDAAGPLPWSPEMWTAIVEQYPRFAAHVLQSSYAKTARALGSGIDAANNAGTIGQLQRMRGIDDTGKAIPGGLLDRLEKTMPNSKFSTTGADSYADTRRNWGDVKGAQEALRELENFKTAAQKGENVADIIDKMDNWSPRQKEAALSQITAFVHDSMGAKVSNLTPGQAGTGALTAPNLTQLGNDNFLQALRKVFGKNGDALANDIELARSSTTFNTDINRRLNSRTETNAQNVRNSPSLYENPAGLEGGAIDNSVKTLTGMATVGSIISPANAPILAMIPAVNYAWNLYKKGKRLTNEQRNQLADFFFRSREAGLDGEQLLNNPPKPNLPSPLGYAGNVVTGGAIGGAAGYFGSDGDPTTTAQGIALGAVGGGIRAAGRAYRANDSIIKPPPARGPRRGPPPFGGNRVTGAGPAPQIMPPGSPPVQNGFFGGGRQPPKPPVPKAPVAADIPRPVEPGPVPSIASADLRPAVAKNVTTFNPQKPGIPKIGQTQNIASVTTKDGRQYDVTAEVFKDRDAVVMSPSYPSNIADDLAGAMEHQQSSIRAEARGMKLANDAPRAPDWATQNPAEWGDVQRQVGTRFLGMVNSTPGPHILALVDGVDVNSLGSMIQDGMPKGKVLLKSPANGELAVVDRGAMPEQFQRWDSYNPRYGQSIGQLPAPADWASAKPAATSAPSSVTPLKPAPKPPTRQGMGGDNLPMDEGARMARAREQGFDVDTPLYHATTRDFEKFTPSNWRGAVFLSDTPDGAVRGASAGGLEHPALSGPTAPTSKAAGPSIYPVYVRGKIFGKSDVPEWFFPREMTHSEWRNARANAMTWEPPKELGLTTEEKGFVRSLRHDALGQFDEIDASGQTMRFDGRGGKPIGWQSFEGAEGSSSYGPTVRGALKKLGYDGALVADESGVATAIFDPANIRGKFAKFDPAESSSSKLLAGLGGPSGAGAAGGGILGYALNPADANGDGVIDDLDRGLNGFGAMVSGGIGGGIAGKALGSRAGKFGNRMKGPPKFRAPDAQTFGGVNAKTADRAALGRAQNMEAEGASRDEIWDATGWFKGVDGKWRFEIDDSGLERKALPFGGMAGTRWQLGKHFTDADAGGAYPDVAKISTELDYAFPDGPGGGYVSPDVAKERITIYGRSSDHERSLVAHERQHAIQNREGFATGGSPGELSYSEYQRLAGETEARNVQTRRNFTPEERRARRPWETQDVPDDQQIVRFGSGKAESRPKPPPNRLASGPPKPKPRPVEARRAAPRGNKPFSDPRLSPGENKTAEMILNGHTYEEIADEMITSVDVVKKQASNAQKKLGADMQLPRPGMGKRPPGSTKREAAFELFDSGVNNAQIAERLGMSIGNVKTYRSYWREQSRASVASIEGAAYNPPAMPTRPFEADYPQKDWPNGPPVDAQGRLTQDMDRKPLDPNSVVIGRNKAPGNGPNSEADRPLRDRIAVIQTLKQAGSSLERVPRSSGQASGMWAPNFDANGRFTGRGSTQIVDDLDRPITGLDDQEVITLSHELAHSIDFKGAPSRNVGGFNDRKWGIDHTALAPEHKAELESQLERIYRDLNNPVDGEVKIRTPKDRGYEAIDADRELWAEAIRAYMYDPNYIKTVAPDVAFMIRDHVNRNSSLRKTIQFNAVPTIVGLGGLGLGAAALSSQPAEAQNR